MSQDASQMDGGWRRWGERDEALCKQTADSWCADIANVIVLLQKQRKTAVDAGFILGDWLVQCLCWQKLKEWGIIG